MEKNGYYGQEMINTWEEKINKWIRNICSKVFRLKEKDINDYTDFEQYGIDSVMIRELNEKLQEKIPELPLNILFECNNIDKLSKEIISKYSKKLKKEYWEKDETRCTENIEWEILDSYFRKPENSPNLTYSGFDDEIAIIGVSGRYPEADNLETFWENLKNKKDCIQQIPIERWNIDEYFDPDFKDVKPGKIYCKWGGFLNDIDKFDPLFFNISPAEAEMIDPQERIFLEVAWETLEDAGYTRKSLREDVNKKESARVGVFVATTSQTYQLWGAEELVKGNPILPNSTPWSIANRVSYVFNFTGPSMPVDTSCSSGLTAIHLACESIKRGECFAALVGGVNLYLHPLKYIAMCYNKMLSPTGVCSAFGNNANGLVPGEGVGALLLKPLHKAIESHDNIYGVIKSTGINHDGKTNGFTVPNPKAQALLIRNVLEKKDILPSDISYIEAHGTGTKLGDPIEITALAQIFKNYYTNKKCYIGSLKPNIGHLEAMAGIASMTKVLLMFKNKKILPSIHAEIKNENIDFNSTPFIIPEEVMAWESIDDKSRMAGISSFGAGGTNGHVILAEYTRSKGTQKKVSSVLFVLSAKDTEQLKKYCTKMIEFLSETNYTLQDIAYTLQVGRESMEERLAIVANDIDAIVLYLKDYLENKVSSIHVNNIPSISCDSVDNIYKVNIKEEPVSEKQLEELREKWLQGFEIDWESLYGMGDEVYRVSLPTYPFKKLRCYVELTDKQVVLAQKEEREDRLEEIKEKDTEINLINILINTLSKVLKIEPKEINIDKAFMDLGIDSILGFKFINEVNNALKLNLTETIIFDYSNIRNLAKYIYSNMNLEKESEKCRLDILDVFKALESQQITVDVAKKLLEDKI